MKSSCSYIKVCLTLVVFLFGLVFVNSSVQGSSINQKDQVLAWVPLLLSYSIKNYIKDVDTNDEILESEIVIDQHGREVVITQIMILFKNEARLSHIDQLLEEYNATITRSVSGTRVIIIRIPRPTNLDDYYSIINQIEAKSFVEFVLPGVLPGKSGLPSSFEPEPTQPPKLNSIRNHIAIRGPAAWNVKNAIQGQPRLAIVDEFGNGDPIAPKPFNYRLISGEFSEVDRVETHGYEVLGVMLASHESFLTTGLFPENLPLGVFDLRKGYYTWNNIMLGTIHLLKELLKVKDPSQKNIVLNTSIAEKRCFPVEGSRLCRPVDWLRKDANLWISLLRDTGLHYKVLHVTAAGNMDPLLYTDIDAASSSSAFSSAALLDGLAYNGTPTFNLSNTNTLVVENIVGTDPYHYQSPPTIGECIHGSSYVGGNISGIGTHIISFLDPVGKEISKDHPIFGTSYSTPQVSALAAYLWAIKPTLKPSIIIRILQKTADPVPSAMNLPECKEFNSPAPIIDAYEAVLSLDASELPTKINSPVRFALLDVNNDMVFNHDDLNLIYNVHFNNDTPIIPSERDWGRYDLNGDGWTTPVTTVPQQFVGTRSTAVPFDLNRIGSTQYGSPNITTEITHTINNDTVIFNENEVTDLDILCYYAYSSLYSGDTNQRDSLLEELCNPICENSPTNWWLGKEWQRCSEPVWHSWESAQAYCQELTLDGKADWRLPTKDELKSLVVCTNGHPVPLEDGKGCGSDWYPLGYAKPTIDSSFQCFREFYWSATEIDSVNAWGVDFNIGVARGSQKSFGIGNALCIR